MAPLWMEARQRAMDAGDHLGSRSVVGKGDARCHGSVVDGGWQRAMGVDGCDGPTDISLPLYIAH